MEALIPVCGGRPLFGPKRPRYTVVQALPGGFGRSRSHLYSNISATISRNIKDVHLSCGAGVASAVEGTTSTRVKAFLLRTIEVGCHSQPDGLLTDCMGYLIILEAQPAPGGFGTLVWRLPRYCSWPSAPKPAGPADGAPASRHDVGSRTHA